MDQELLKLLTKIKIMGKRVMGMEIDIMRLNSDRQYASNTLKHLSGSENEELVMIAIEFMGKLGLLEAESPEPEPAAETAGGGDDTVSSRYTGRLR